MAARMDFYVLDVLQGLGTFAALYDDNDKLVGSMLLDLGTERYSEKDPFPSVFLVGSLLKTMDQPTLDAIILSHSDTDHISLLAQLLSYFKPVGTPHVPVKDTLLVKLVKYGGQHKNYTKGRAKKNVLSDLQAYVPQDGQEHIFGSASPETTFTFKETEKKKWQPFVTVQGASVYILLANTVPTQADLGEEATELTRKVPDGYGKNVVSVVSIVDYRSSQIVVTGDATGLTLAGCNNVMDATDVGLDLLLDNFMVTAPHHGSETTTYDLLGISTEKLTKEQLAEANLAAFVRNMGARTLTASAGQVQKFKHPSARVVQAFWSELGNYLYTDPRLTDDRHFYTAYFKQSQYNVDLKNGTAAQWPGTATWWTAQTHRNIYTNLYFLSGNQAPVLLPPSPGEVATPVTSGPGLPPLGANWIFRVPKTLGIKRSVHRLDNRVTSLALRAQALGLRPTAAFAAYAGPAVAAPPPITLATQPGLVPIRPPAVALPVLGLASGPPPAGPAAPPRAPAPPPGLGGLRVIP